MKYIKILPLFLIGCTQPKYQEAVSMDFLDCTEMCGEHLVASYEEGEHYRVCECIPDMCPGDE